MANLLSKEVAVTVSQDARVKNIGDSALLSAIQRRDTEMVQFLIEAGANVNELSNFSTMSFIGTALQAAAARGRTDIVQLLFEKGSNINEPLQGQSAMTALQAAVHFGHVNTAKFLLEHGADVNASATNYEASRTALLTATINKNLVMVKLLLDFGAEL
ncbi:ankyrin, partial [Mollisia scopiformis]